MMVNLCQGVSTCVSQAMLTSECVIGPLSWVLPGGAGVAGDIDPDLSRFTKFPKHESGF